MDHRSFKCEFVYFAKEEKCTNNFNKKRVEKKQENVHFLAHIFLIEILKGQK